MLHPNNLPSPPLYTLAEAARLLAGPTGRAPHPSTLVRWIQKRHLKAYRVGGSWRVTLAALNQFIEDATQRALGSPHEGRRAASPVDHGSLGQRLHKAKHALSRFGL